jgi:hypothetical protein
MTTTIIGATGNVDSAVVRRQATAGARRPHQMGWRWLVSRHSVGESP